MNWQSTPVRCGRDRDELVDRKLFRALLSTLDLIEANLDLLRVILREALAGDRIAAERYRTLRDSWEAQIRDLLIAFERRRCVPPGFAHEISRGLVRGAGMAIQDRMLLMRVPASARSSDVRSFVLELTRTLANGHDISKVGGT
jgi:hypothetical protein